MKNITLYLLFLISCTPSHKSSHLKTPSFDAQGHRGCRALMPENTIPAFMHAMDLGVTTLEMDAVITADQKVILSHEPFFNHDITTQPDGRFVNATEEKQLNIYKMDYATTQRYDVGMKPHPRFPEQQKFKASKPLLSETFDAIEAYTNLKKYKPVFYNIETKTQPETDGIYHPDPETFVRLLVGVIDQHQLRHRVIIQSFDFRTLKILHQLYPDIQTAALVELHDKGNFDTHLEALGFMPTIYSPEYHLVDATLVAACHHKKVRIIPWTVNDKASISRLKNLGVDGIISDDPRLFSEK